MDTKETASFSTKCRPLNALSKTCNFNFSVLTCMVLFFFLSEWFFFFLIYLFYFGCTGSPLLHSGFSLVEGSRGYPLLRCTGFSLRWLLLLRSTGPRRAGSRAQAQQLWCMDPAAPPHVGSSQTRAQTRVPCIGRRILNHCATREALYGTF